MELMAKVGEINILIGDEVAGSVTAQLINVPWDKAFNVLLDLKIMRQTLMFKVI